MNRPSPDKVVEVLYSHYKDSFEHIRCYTSQRNRLLFYLLCLVGLMHFVSL